MLRADFRTLLIVPNGRPPIEEVAAETETELRSEGPNAYTLACSDGSTAALNFWQFEGPGGPVSKSRMSVATRFRGRDVGVDAERRRDRILLRVQQSDVALVVGDHTTLSPSVLRFIAALAKRTDAIVYNFSSLHRATGEKLLDIDGYVTEDVPTDYPELPGRPKPAPLTSWTEAPMVLTWVSKEEAKRSTTGDAAASRVLVESPRQRKEFVGRLFELLARLERAEVSLEAEDRRNRLSFAVGRATALVEASDLPAVARRLHGISFIGSEARDELGRLVLSTSGEQDPRAWSPRELLLLSRDPSPEGLRRAEQDLSANGLSVSVAGRLDRSSSRLAALAIEFIEVTLDLSPKARRRRSRITQFLNGGVTVIVASGRVPMDLDQIGRVRHCSVFLDAITFDGWGFFDSHGRALLVRSGALDPAARFAEVARAP